MELTIEQPCPNCGAPIHLKEDDRLIKCPYCDVFNYKIKQKLPRYTLPVNSKISISPDELFYIPYLRFKGSVIYCQNGQVKHNLIDTTRVGADINSLPVSLGLRPQAMNVFQVTEGLKGTFIRQTEKASKIFKEAARLTALFKEKKNVPVVHRAFIGETVSRVYLPVYLKNDMLFDGITGEELGRGKNYTAISSEQVQYSREWEPHFLSTICPSCGDMMRGSTDSLVLQCTNCDTFWSENKGKYIKWDYYALPPLEPEGINLPFWKIEVIDNDLEVTSFADFLRLTNQPVVVRENHEGMPLSFFIPAFKVNPGLLLQTSKNLTVMQEKFAALENCPVRNCHSVTFPYSEAVQALKSVLVSSSVSTKRIMKILPQLMLQVKSINLVYLPFKDTGHDYIQHHTGVSIGAAALRFGRSL